MNNPLISVIIPTFNSVSTVRACFDSVTGQTFRDMEIIVADGASVDGTVAVINEYAARFPALRWVSEKDSGTYDAINKGIRMASGEWIFILGSDDTFYSTETLAAVAGRLQKSKAGVIYGNVLVKGDAGWAKDGEVHAGEFDLERLLQRNICQQSVFYRRSLFETLGYFSTAYPVCADWDFMLRCAAKSRPEYIDVIVAVFSGGGASKTVKEIKFYEDLPGNLYNYFGLRIFGKSFRPVGWRFRKQAETCRQNGKRIQAFLFRMAAKRQGA